MNLDELVNIVFMYTVNSLGILFNSVLLYAIIYRSPQQIQNYSFLLLNVAVTDLTSCFLAISLIQRIIPFEDSILYISSGVCSHFGRSFCFYSYGITLVLYSHTNWCLLASILFRYYIVKYKAPTKRVVMIGIVLLYVPSLFQLGILTIFIAGATDKSALEIFSRIHPEIRSEERTIYGALHVTTPALDWKPFAATWMAIIPHVPIVLLVLFFCRQIFLRLEKRPRISKKSQRVNGQLLKTLTLQSCLPIFYLVALIVYLVQQYDLVHNIWLEYGFMNLISVIPALNPLLPLFFVHSYRDFLDGFLPKRQRASRESTESTRMEMVERLS